MREGMKAGWVSKTGKTAETWKRDKREKYNHEGSDNQI